MKTQRVAIVGLIAVIVLVTVGVLFYYEGQLTPWVEKNILKQGYRPSFESVAAPNSLFANIKTYRGDHVCDMRINELALNPNDCVVSFRLDPGQPALYGTFTGVVTAKNVDPAMRDLREEHVRCYLDAATQDCALTKTGSDEKNTTYHFSARRTLGYSTFGFVPIGVEVRIRPDFHFAAVDYYRNVRSEEFLYYKQWGRDYQFDLVPIVVGGETVESSAVEGVEVALRTAVEHLQQESSRLGITERSNFTFGKKTPCTLTEEDYQRSISGFAYSCGIDVHQTDIQQNRFIVFVNPRESCPTFSISGPGYAPPFVPATYGTGQICVATKNVAPVSMATYVFHELLHGFGAGDHYDWLEGKDPSYKCNVADGLTICPVAAQELGWTR